MDDIRRSRFSRSDYASYIDYPPRILIRIHQTSIPLTTTAPSRPTQLRRQVHPQLKLKGTVEEQCFDLPLPASGMASSQLLLSTQQSSQLGTQSQLSTPTTKWQSINSVPDPKDLGEKVTPHLFPKWYHVGIQLGLPPATLTGIERQHQNDIRRCMNEVFHEWISRGEADLTWRTLIDALRADSISERQLASELERTFD